MILLSPVNTKKLYRLFFLQLNNPASRITITENTPLQAVTVNAYDGDRLRDSEFIFYPDGGRQQALTDVRAFLNELGALIVALPLSEENDDPTHERTP